MRIVFMGTPDFAVPSLQALIDQGHEICGVYTQPDKPKGRGHKLLPPPVKELALQNGLPVYQPLTLRDEAVQEELARLAPELIVVVAYGNCCRLGYWSCQSWAASMFMAPFCRSTGGLRPFSGRCSMETL